MFALFNNLLKHCFSTLIRKFHGSQSTISSIPWFTSTSLFTLGVTDCFLSHLSQLWGTTEPDLALGLVSVNTEKVCCSWWLEPLTPVCFILFKKWCKHYDVLSMLFPIFQPLSIVGDITNEEDVKRIVEETVKHFGRLDVLVYHCAQIGYSRKPL